MRSTKDFGLVFERHLPEEVRLLSHPIKQGVKVQVRNTESPLAWVVSSVKDGLATLIGDDGQESTLPVEDLVVVRGFGEPIYPGLRSVGRIERGGDKPFHTVINGENFYALETLLFAHEGQVDCIYIDPPYNSGARDWTYNNDYVDDNDVYRHSKWLSFMEKRLILARRLLKPDSAVVVTIDEHEVTRLGVLLSQVFPDAEITLVTIVNNTKGVTRAGVPRFSRVEEYAYFCFFGNAGVSSIGDDLLTDGEEESSDVDDELGETEVSDGSNGPSWRKLLRSGDASRREDREKMFYPIWIEPKTLKIVEVGDYLPLNKAPSFRGRAGGVKPVWPVRQNGTLGRWGVGPDTLRKLVDRGFVKVGRFDSKRKTWGVSYLTEQVVADVDSGKYAVESRDEVTGVANFSGTGTRQIKTVWFRKRHNAGVGGTTLVSQLVGAHRPFNFPKSVFALRDTLEMLTKDKRDALIVDFFGGSGTTAHAAMMLNAEDGGRRRCILVTNNEVEVEEQVALRARGLYPGQPAWEERGIFYRATKPRLEAAATGIRTDGSPVPASLKNADGTLMNRGLEENVEFLELTYLDRNSLARGKAYEAIAPLLWMRFGSSGTLIGKVQKPYAMPRGARYAVLFDASHWSEFVEALRNNEDVLYACVVTDSLAQYQQVAAEIDPRVSTVMLYDDYLRNFEISAGAAL